MPKCRLCHHDTQFLFNSHNIHGHHQINHHQYKQYLCPECKSISLENIKINQKYYQNAYQQNYYPDTNILISFLKSISFKLRLLTISRFLSPKHHNIKILDIGCGNGEFLEYLPSDKYIKSGLEINPNSKKFHHNLKATMYYGDINTVNFKKVKFDCIVLWHVLEHLPDPKISLYKIYKLLKPNSLLLIAVPNSQSLGLLLGKSLHFHLDSPRHLFIPSVSGLNHLLSDVGFQNIKIFNLFYEYPLDLFWSLKNSPWRFLIYPFYPLFKIFSSETICLCAFKK